MSKRPRLSPSPVIKAKVALAAIKGEKTLAKLSQQFDGHPDQTTQWCSQIWTELPEYLGLARRALSKNYHAIHLRPTGLIRSLKTGLLVTVPNFYGIKAGGAIVTAPNNPACCPGRPSVRPGLLCLFAASAADRGSDHSGSSLLPRRLPPSHG